MLIIGALWCIIGWASIFSLVLRERDILLYDLLPCLIIGLTGPAVIVVFACICAKTRWIDKIDFSKPIIRTWNRT